MQVKKQQLEPDWEEQTGSKYENRKYLGIEKRKRSTSRLYIVTLLFNLYAEYIMRNAGLKEAQTGIKIARRNINNVRYAMTPPLWQKVKRN